MKRFIYSIALMALCSSAMTAQEYDDIYYNPKKDTSTQTEKKKKNSNYIQDFSSIDVDEYNRRGQYYESPLDTIGIRAENDEDFVYTQKIQKFYNPTIVVDNYEVLNDVLLNSYGNVDIVFDNGVPYFSSIYGWPGYYNYYSWLPSWRWTAASSWYWSPVWGYDLWPTWGLGPSWAWGPSWSWGWGPSWAWGPSYGWGWGWGPSWNRPYYAYGDYIPGGRLPNRPGNNWAANTRPGSSASHGRAPIGSNTGSNGVATNYHRSYNTGTTGTSGYRTSGSSYGNNRGSYSVGSDGHRRYGSSSGSSGSTYTNSNNSHRSSSSSSGYNRNSSNYNSNRNSSTGRSSSSGSYNSGRSGSSGSFGSGRSSGGGSYGGGRSSSGGGRGHR